MFFDSFTNFFFDLIKYIFFQIGITIILDGVLQILLKLLNLSSNFLCKCVSLNMLNKNPPKTIY
ncbi:MAG: hypothetical protein CFE39_07240 [Comamonadaceae bacterium PBBC2]|nr:MAG: hypothetical protein CFE39_07240 [Comamonadaceae bacterium PBBC2]